MKGERGKGKAGPSKRVDSLDPIQCACLLKPEKKEDSGKAFHIDPIQCACLLISISSRKRKNKERVSLRPGRGRPSTSTSHATGTGTDHGTGTDGPEIPVTQVTFTGCYTKLTEAPRLSLRLPNHPILFQNALSRRTALRWGGYFLFLNWGYFFFLNWCYFLNKGKSLQDPCLSFLASSAWIPVSLL